MERHEAAPYRFFDDSCSVMRIAFSKDKKSCKEFFATFGTVRTDVLCLLKEMPYFFNFQNIKVCMQAHRALVRF